MASSPAGSAGVPKKAPPGQVCHQTPEAASGPCYCHWIWLSAAKHCRDAHQEDPKAGVPDALLEELGRIFGVMPMQAFLQRVQAFLAELKARPLLLAEAAALMEREGGLKQMEPLLDWVPGTSQEVFAFQDGPSRPTSVDPPRVWKRGLALLRQRECPRPKHRFRRPHRHALSL